MDWLNKYFKACQALLEKKGMTNALMLSDTFAGAAYWAPYWTPGEDNIVFDSRVYYWANGSYSAPDLGRVACAQAAAAVTSFPVFVGEWDAAATYNNTLAGRAVTYESQAGAWKTWLAGGAFWNIKDADTSELTSGSVLTGIITDAGEGLTKDYRGFFNLVDAGLVEVGGALTHASC